MNDEEIKDLIEDLDTIGHAQRIQMSVSLGINSNEFMLTNVSVFFSAKKKEFEDKGVELIWISSAVELMWISSTTNSSSGAPRGHTLLLTGIPWNVRRAYEEVLKWAWVDPETTSVNFEETVE
jgi:hypothetical protein